MTLTERRAAVRAALLADPQRSCQSVADEIRCSWEMVAGIRAKLIAEGAIKDGPVRGNKGHLSKYHRVVPVKYLHFTTDRIRRIVATVSSPKFTVAWGRSEESTKRRMVEEIGRLERLLKNLRARMPAEEPKHRGPNIEIRTYRTPRRIAQ